MTFSLFIIVATLIMVMAVLRIFFPEIYAKYVLRIRDRHSFAKWSESSSNAGSIVTLVLLPLILLVILMRHLK